MESNDNVFHLRVDVERVASWIRKGFTSFYSVNEPGTWKFMWGEQKRENNKFRNGRIYDSFWNLGKKGA